MEVIETIQSNKPLMIVFSNKGKPSESLLKKLANAGLDVPDIIPGEPVSSFYISTQGNVSLIFSFDNPRDVSSFSEDCFCKVDDNQLSSAYSLVVKKRSLLNSLPEKLNTVKAGIRLLSYDELSRLSRELDTFIK